MIGICLAAAGLMLSVPTQTFTLGWTHSIEKIRWEEDYTVVSTPNGARLLLTEARIRGSGAGMEPPPDAVLADGVWHYKPPLAPLERLNLARSGYGADDGTDYRADYSLCWDGRCHGMAKLIGTPAVAPLVEVSACRS